MKIIRLQPRRRRPIHSEADLNVANSTPKQKKKALLVGINYGEGLNGSLKGPHKDVEEMRKLLIDKYGYNPADITTMIDDNKSKKKHLQPTKVNLRREIEALIAGAKRGDHFFFHYAGHVVQGELDPKSKEEDKREEYIVPSDGDQDNLETCIQDDTLRELLVNRLPSGARLVAVFDSCHSASLLDLEHFRCNRVYVPWISKGRRKSDSMWNDVQRKSAILRTRTIQQHIRMTEANVKSRQTSIGQLCASPSSVTSSQVPSLSSSTTSMSASTSTRPSTPMRIDTYFNQMASSTPVSTAPTTPTSLSPANTVSFSTAPLKELKQKAIANAAVKKPTSKPTLRLSASVTTTAASTQTSTQTPTQRLSRAGTLTGKLTRSGTVTRSGTITTKMKKKQATIKAPYTPSPATPPTSAVVTSSTPMEPTAWTPWLTSGPTIEPGQAVNSDKVSFVESPVQDFCSGWCRCQAHNPETDSPDFQPRMMSRMSTLILPEGLNDNHGHNQRQASVGDVISLSSCKDSQRAWEDGDGHSMTQILVRELKNDPHPTMKDLMLTLSHKLHTAAVSMHQQTKTYKKRCVSYRRKHRQSKSRGMSDTDGLEMNNFQDPELSSRKPLDMGQEWNM